MRVEPKGQSSRAWEGETRLVDEELVKRVDGDLSTPIYCLARPPAMVETVRQTLNHAGINDDDIRSEEFTATDHVPEASTDSSYRCEDRVRVGGAAYLGGNPNCYASPVPSRPFSMQARCGRECNRGTGSQSYCDRNEFFGFAAAPLQTRWPKARKAPDFRRKLPSFLCQSFKYQVSAVP
jgi:hypothetical protein